MPNRGLLDRDWQKALVVLLTLLASLALLWVLWQVVSPILHTLVLFAHSPDNIINTNHMDNQVMDPTPALEERLAKIHSEKVQGQFLYLEVASAKVVP